MNAGFADHFTFDYFLKLIRAARERFEPIWVSQLPEVLENERTPVLILRHDVDVSLTRALEMARLEHECGMPATYMIMPNAPLYQIQTPAAKQALREIRHCGHEIGLHFDITDWFAESEPPTEALASAIAKDAEKLEDAAGAPVSSFSFHRPLPALLRGKLRLGGRVNAYANEAMNGYMSDSKCNWRDGEPLPRIINSPHRVLQVLIHPIWWGPEHLAGPDRLEAFFLAETPSMSPQERQEFDRRLAQSVPAVRRSGYGLT